MAISYFIINPKFSKIAHCVTVTVEYAWSIFGADNLNFCGSLLKLSKLIKILKLFVKPLQIGPP